jgi:hypothetical protein
MVKLKELLNESTYVKGKRDVIVKGSFRQVHKSLTMNVTEAPMSDKLSSIKSVFKKAMKKAHDDYVKAVAKASKPFDNEITGV